MGIVFKNNAKTTLASSLSNSATSATVTDGSVFPSLSAGEFFLVTFDDGTNNEICKCTARSGNTLTIVRAQESTTARAFSSGDGAEGRVTAGVLEQIQENIAAKSANQTVFNTTTSGGATTYNIGTNPGVEANAMVFLNGVLQHHDTLSFSGTNLTFDAAPPNGMALEVIIDNLINLQSSNLTVDSFTAADVSGSPQTDFTLSDAPAAETNLIVFVDGVFQDQDAYTISSNTLSITTGVIAGRGVTVYVINPVNIGTPSDSTVTSAKLSGNILMPGTLTVGSNDVAFDSPTFVVDHANSRVGLGIASPTVPVDIVGDVKMSANLTVDTTTLVVDSSNNRVGIGSASPAYKLDLHGAMRIQSSRATFVDASEDATASAHIFVSNDGVGDFSQEAGHLVIQARTHTSVYRDIIFAGGINNASDLMRITGEGKVGIGGSPKTDLDISSSTGGILTLTSSDTSGSANQLIGKINFYNADPSGDGAQNSVAISAHQLANIGNGGYLTFATTTGDSGSEGADPTERMRIGASGKTSFSAGGIGAVATQDRDFTFYTEGSTNGIDIRSNDYRNILLGSGGSSGAAMDSGFIGLYKDGNSKIGINASGNSFIYADSGSIPNSTSTNLLVQDTTSLAAGVGGSIVFSGIYTGSTALSNGPYIKAFKTNATDGDYGFGLRFAIRENGSSQKTGMEISSTGEVSKPLQPYTAAYNNASQTVSAVTWTDWAVNTTLEHNQASSMRTATSTFTMPVSGVYLCTGVLSIESVNATNYALARVVFSSHNDVELGIFEKVSSNTYGYDVPINFMFKAVSGETMKVQTFSGSGTHVIRGGSASHIEIMLIG